MPKMYNDRKVIFKKNEQRKYLLSILSGKKLGLTKLSKDLSINRRTLADWLREKHHMSENGLNKIKGFVHAETFYDVEYVDRYEHVSSAGKKGYRATIKKYGEIPSDNFKRRSNWEKWWNESGKFSNKLILLPKFYNKPRLSKDLAEFCGVMIGDGGMSKYQLTITLHNKDDKDFGEYVAVLMEKLFHVKPTVLNVKNVNTYTISRIQLVKYLNNLGLKIGNKIDQDLDIPVWIQENDNFIKRCIRGIFDTDGCLVIHKYTSNGKVYVYKKVDITSRSPSLLTTIHKTLSKFEIKSRIGKNCIRVESIKDVERFFKVIGSSNQKHLSKYNQPIT